jgi:hypothetical protein
MAKPAPKDSEAIAVSEVPLWVRAIQVAALGGLIGLGITFGMIYNNFCQAEAVTDIFKQSRRPILQYRLERGAWPSNFTFDKIPAALEPYEFGAIARGARELDVRGSWQFASVGVEGKIIPMLIFKPEDKSLNSLRILSAVDAQLDDGQEAAGRLRVTDAQAEFTLMAE